MRIAVTGATGFIGRAVLAELSNRGIAAVACSRSGSAPVSPAGHRAVALDLHEQIGDAFDRLGRPELVIHLAWGGLPNYRSLNHVESELPAQYRFLRNLVEGGVQSLVVAGTCFEYGMQSGALAPTLETRPDNPYGYAKDALRRQLQFLQATRPFRLAWARLFYLWGEGQAASSLYPLLRQAVARGDARFPMSGGEQLRDYLPVAEVARQLVDLALDPRANRVTNICSGRPVSVRALVERWIAEHGWAITPELGRYPYPDYEPLAFWGVPDAPQDGAPR